MAGIKIGDLPELTTDPQDNDYLVVVDTSVDTTKKLSLSKLITLASIFDSAETTSLIDSDYIQARQSFDAASTISLLSTTGVQSIIPAVDSAYDLGSASNKWKDLYLSGSSIYIGDQVITSKKVSTLSQIVSVREFGATGDGSTDDTDAFIAAVASGAGSIYIPSGTYVISSPINVDRDIFIYGDGQSSKIEVSGLADDERAFHFVGSGGTLIETNSNPILANSRRYTFSSSGHGLEADDLFCIWDDSDYSYSSKRNYYYKGEFLTVNNVDGAVVSFDASFYDDYAAGSSKLYKVSTISIGLKDFNIVSSGSLFAGIDMHFCRGCTVDNVNINLSQAYTGLYLHNCYDVSIINCSNKIADYIPGGALNIYPFLVGNSQRVRATNCDGVSRWHAFGVGGASDGLNIVNRNIIVTGCTLSSQNGSFAGDFHGNTEHSTYANCTFHGSGCTMGGDYNSFVNNKIMDITRDVTGGTQYPDSDYIGSQGFYASEATGYNFLISGNLMECSGSYIANGFGRFVSFVRTSVATQPHTSNLQITNNNYLNLDSARPFSDAIIRIYDGSINAAPNNVDILIDGNTLTSKNDPVSGTNSILIGLDETDSDDRFQSITITNNKLNRVDINLDHCGEVHISGNELNETFQGINLVDYKNCVIKDNIIKGTRASALGVLRGYGDYTIVDGNVITDSWSTLTPQTGTSQSADVFISTGGADDADPPNPTGATMEYVRVSNNFIKSNGAADYALVYNNSYNVQDYGNTISGSGAKGKVFHWFQDSSQFVTGHNSLTTREFWHSGTTQTDFATITFGNVVVNGSAVVRLHMANNVSGYSGILEFTLEGENSSTTTVSGTRFTSTNNPVPSRVIIDTSVAGVATLSTVGASSTEVIHCKAEIIKSTGITSLRALTVEWGV